MALRFIFSMRPCSSRAPGRSRLLPNTNTGMPASYKYGLHYNGCYLFFWTEFWTEALFFGHKKAEKKIFGFPPNKYLQNSFLVFNW